MRPDLTEEQLAAFRKMMAEARASLEETQTEVARGSGGVNPLDQTSVQVKLCCAESGPPQIRQEAHIRGWNATASYCTHPR